MHKPGLTGPEFLISSEELDIVSTVLRLRGRGMGWGVGRGGGVIFNTNHASACVMAQTII